MLLIRPAKINDINIIHLLDIESTTYHKKFDKHLYTVSQKWWNVKKTSQIKALKDPRNLIVVAEENNKVIAYAWGYVERLTKFNIGKIQEMVVASKYRRKGVATQLLKKMFDFFRIKKCVISEVEVHIKNKPAIEFYEKSNFVKQTCKMRLNLDKTKSFSPLK